MTTHGLAERVADLLRPGRQRLGALMGVLTRGVVSTLSSMWLQRRQETRRRRSELFDQHVQRVAETPTTTMSTGI